MNMMYQIASPVGEVYKGSPVDERDFVFAPEHLPHQLDKFIDLRQDIFEIENQYSVGSCVSNAILGDLETIRLQNGSPEDYSRMAHYVMSKIYSNRLSADGLFPRDAYEVARKYGVCLESDYEYDESVQYQRPPEEIYQLCEQRKIERWEAVVRSNLNDGGLEDRVYRIHAALQLGLTVGFGMTVTDSLYSLTGPWYNHKYKLAGNADAEIVGGHMMRIVGIDTERRMFIVLNSWGTGWADGGYCGLPFEIVMQPFFEAYVVRKFTGMGVAEKPGIKKVFQNDFKLDLRIVLEDHEVGELYNIWMGAVLKDGTRLLRLPITHEQLTTTGTPFDKSLDQWGDAASGQPVVTKYPLQKRTFMRGIVWRDMTPYRGADFYVGYGTGTLWEALLGINGKVEKVCTL